jgi:hypothetical protein
MNPKKQASSNGSANSNGNGYFNYQSSRSSQPAYSPAPLPANHHDDDDDRKPLSQSLGDTSSSVLRFMFSPGLVIFATLMFIGFCFYLNAASYHDTLSSGFSEAVDRFGRSPLPRSAPPDERFQQFLMNIPVLGDGFRLLYKMFGNLFTAVLATLIAFLVQATELLARVHWYFEKAGHNILFKLLNQKRPEYQRNSSVSRRVYKQLSGSEQTILRVLFLLGCVAYVFDIWNADQARPWLDTAGNPIAAHWVWNVLSVFGIEIALLIHRGYRMIEPMWNRSED